MGDRHFRVLILGGGTGGIAVGSRVVKKVRADSLGLVEPSEKHFYQPLWTLVGGGIVPKEKSVRLQKDLMPKGAVWVKDRVLSVDPAAKAVRLLGGDTLTYDSLVVSTGLQLDWRLVEGALERLGQDGVCSIYDFQHAEKTHATLEGFRGGTAIFTMPPVPIKCAGAPQKIMYLADEIFRRNGVRERTKLIFATAGASMFAVPEFGKALEKIVARKNIQVLFGHRLTGVQGKGARFQTATGEVTVPFDLLHVVPPMSAHAWVKESGLANDAGWLSVDKHTLQHTKHPEIFGVGDVTGVPNSKTGAAIRKQAPVVVENLFAQVQGGAPTAKYDGYASCPLVTGFGKVMLAEFGYDGKLMPSFPLNPTKERRSMWLLKRYGLPVLYWSGMMKGRA